MADTVAQVEAERVRLQSGGRSLVARVTQTRAQALAGEAALEVKDSRSVTDGENEALTAYGYTPGSWHPYTVAQSQATFS